MLKSKALLIGLLAGSLFVLNGIPASAAEKLETKKVHVSKDFIKGADISTLYELEKAGAKFYENGNAKDAFSILKKNGINYIRLRIWNDPYDKNGNAYGAGTNDLEKTIALAKRAKKAGMKVLLDFHYSDFWVDPGKQNLPKAWKDKSFEELTDAVYDYTSDVLTAMKKKDVYPDMVQIGNELNSGMLWPYGKSWGEGGGEFDRLATLLKAGIKAVHDTEGNKDTKVMLHLAEGGKYETFKWWFDEITARDVEFDIIGVSYYPFWHGTFDELQNNMDTISKRYDKEVIVVETAYGFTTENGDTKKNAFGEKEAKIGGYPATVQGQYDFLADLMNAIDKVPDEKGIGMFYWEPMWIPNEKVSWATDAGMKYLGVDSDKGNEWDNQALFDFKGNVLDSIKVFKN